MDVLSFDATTPDRARPPAREERVRVLVVEDDDDAAETVRRLLQRYGADVEVAGCAADAMERTRAFHPDLVLTDLSLPDRDGFALIVELREALAGSAPICVAVTGIADAATDARASSARFDRFLLKPVEPTVLKQLVADVRWRRGAPPS